MVFSIQISLPSSNHGSFARSKMEPGRIRSSHFVVIIATKKEKKKKKEIVAPISFITVVKDENIGGWWYRARLEFIAEASFDRDTRVNVAIKISKNGSICAST